MNKIYIDQLLQKYWDTESTLEEENKLKEYFARGQYYPDHAQYADLFNFFNGAKTISLSKEIDFDDPSTVGSRNFKRRINNIFSSKVMGIAASLLLLISVGLFMVNEHNQPNYVGKSTVITNEKEALEMTKEALAYLSIKLDKSSRTISTNVNKMEQVSIIK